MARRSFLNRSFSGREKGLLLVLVVLLVGACHYFFVVKSVADTVAANEQQLEDIRLQVDQQTMLASVRQRMQAELDELGKQQPVPEVAVYDNLKNELDQLNALMASVITYDLKFEQSVLDGHLVRRPVTVSFTTSNYSAALDVVRALGNGAYRCEIMNFSMTGKLLADGSVESVASTFNVTYLETTNGSTNLGGLVEKSAK